MPSATLHGEAVMTTTVMFSHLARLEEVGLGQDTVDWILWLSISGL